MPEDTRLYVAVIQKAVGRKAVTLSNVVTPKTVIQSALRARIAAVISG